MSLESEIDRKDEYECLLDHIILPRVLPHSRHRNLLRHESLLLRRMVDTIDNCSKWIPNATVNLFHSMKRVHFSPSKVEIINTEINALRPGGTFAMFVRKQNCGFMIHMPKEQDDSKSCTPNTVIVSTFPGNLHPREIYSHPSDLEFEYPTQSLRMKYSPMMRSEQFANQLSVLDQSLPVETKIRNYVSTWLMTVLSDESTKIANFQTVRKKIRDEVIGEKVMQKSGIDPKFNITKNQYFRRSSHYAVIKVLLQLNLTIEVGEEAAKIIYKMVMLEYMTRMCEEFENNCYEKLNIDLMTQLMAKMARRIEKLSEMDFEYIDDETNAKHDHIIQSAQANFDMIIDHAKFSISALRTKIDLQIFELQRMADLESQLDQLRSLDFESDVYYNIPKLQDYLRNQKKLMNDKSSSNPTLKTKFKCFIRHCLNQPTAPDTKLFANIEQEIDQNLYLNDFENWILYQLKFKDNAFHCTTIREWFVEYSSIAEQFYTNDPLGTSRMLLVRLKLIGMMDRMATEAYSLFAEHRTSIDTKCFEILLLPQKIDMKIAHELQNYFLQRNQQENVGLIEEKDVNIENGAQLFSYRFAHQNSDMQRIRSEILNECRQKIEQLKLEWEKGREIVMKLQEEQRCMTHEYHSFMDPRGNMKSVHARNCQYCFMKRKINQVQLEQYVRPLPGCIYRQNAIIFEMRIPIEIAALRDVLHLFTQSSQKSIATIDIKGDWMENEQIVAYKGRSQEQMVNLGSTITISVSTLHVTYDFEAFIIDNNKNCILHANRNAIVTAVGVQRLKNRCSFNTEKDSVYNVLNWTLKTTNHTQNQILARQSECPHDLSLSEFIQFGSLRADGYRLQWRKLYAMIETDALSFDQPSVLSLVLQTIWETGITGEIAGFLRESHNDLNNPKFVLEMVNLLNRYTDKQKNNWIHPIKLLIAAFMTVRIYEINDTKDIVDHIVLLLNKIRTIAIDWMNKIENALHAMTNRTQLHEEALRLLLVTVAITGCITFFVYRKHKYFDEIFVYNSTKKMSAARIWLQSAITLNNNILLDTHIKTKTHSELRTFIRLVRYVGIHIEKKMQELIATDQDDIIKLIKKQWTLAEKGKFGKVFTDAECPQCLITKVQIDGKKKNVTIDLVTGAFLVDNLPVARLPDSIHTSSLFEEVFGKYPFEVQPDIHNSFTTLRKYNGCHYEFKCSNNNVNIIEHRDDDTEMQLIPWRKFERFVPKVLIECYSHWWNNERNVIEFRPKSFNDPNFPKEFGEYRLDMNSDRLIHFKTRRSMISINSPSYQLIRDHLLRLEREKFIHVLINEEEPLVADIELPRMNLKFKVDCSIENENGYDMMSNEFSGMRVSLKQNCGTLYGLKHGLLLESIPAPGELNESNSSVFAMSTSKLLLIPHSTVQNDCLEDHANIEINLKTELRSPPFHRYDVDVSLKQLKAGTSNFSAWFYLAYLHAVTSHGQIEPFIGMPGIERSLQILQSSYVWSSSPYDDEAVQTLLSIAKLSPRRSLKKDIQHIEWPEGVIKNSAQDSFVFIVDKLIQDSQRLGILHFQEEPIELKNDLQLNRREYLRCLQLTPNLRVHNIFIEHGHLQTEMPDVPSIDYSTDTRLISSLYHRGAYSVSKELDLIAFLSQEQELSGPLPVNLSSILEHQLTEYTLVNLWMSLYDAARTCQLNQEELTLIWTLYAHQGENIAAILALQAVAMNPNCFSRIDPPPFQNYIINVGTYDMAEVALILQSFYTKPPNYHTENGTDADRNYHKEAIDTEIQQLQLFVDSRWPCDEVDLLEAPIVILPHIDLPEAKTCLNERLRLWNYNRQLYNFIGDVEQRLNELNASTFINQPDLTVTQSYASEYWTKYHIDFEAKMCDQLDDYENDIEDADNYWKMKTKHSYRSVDDWWETYDEIVNSIEKKHLIDAGMYPRMVPSLVLPRITSEETDPRLKSIIGALAMHIADEQRDRRIESYKKQSQMQPAMERELENEPHVNWKPCDYPEWLLFEIEQNLTIRRIQIEIAKRMIEPPGIDKKHSVMQLNMGEGKTAVIVPILAAVLANGKQACQITVLKPLFATNLNSLRQYLGGMLNRRIYTFPCRRDMPITECVDQILELLEECKQMKGVILTLPEHRLSFQLKIYESIQKDEIEAAAKLLEAQNWINTNVRSILDESDAILHAKYQLIYTVGNQLPLDGGDNRWHVAQAVLKRVPHHIEHLFKKYGEEKIEFDENYVENGNVFGYPEVEKRPDVFTPCRILDEIAYTELKQLLVEDFVDGKLQINVSDLKASSKETLKRLLTEKEINAETFKNVMSDFTTVKQDILMILSGLLRFEVLKLALMKRWRVNYGVKEDGPRLMAVPFKAKDVAAEMTEFGHPDVAICLTQLSYYYSGLTDQQLHRVFEALKTNQNAAGVYEKWINSIPDVLIEDSIRNYSGVNLSDPNQRDEILFPLFRYNMYVIDYWLSINVYPREAKTFEKKLMCTAWDLCNDHMEHRVTGFSGTNDTKNILPLPIAQNDLEELEQTNEKVRMILLQPENEAYEKLPSNVSGQMILEKLQENDIPVLLDAGALMLELNNEETAREWLRLTSPKHFDAAVYFDAYDILQTIDRNGVVAGFDCSVYRDNLERCLVYLDDVHTRGTDLKFPLERIACVTLSGDIARDKTVQACMRMRQLGKGHSIAFWASHEADIRIREMCLLSPESHVRNEHVIKFICSNSERFETENTVHWAAAAYNYTKKMVAHKLHSISTEETKLMNLFDKCVDDELVALENMYGDKEEALLTEITANKFNQLASLYQSKEKLANFICSIKMSVVQRLEQQATNVKRFKQALDEHQEKELEQELEEERHVERPPKCLPALPKFDVQLQKLFLNGAHDIYDKLKSSRALQPLSSSLTHTKLFKAYTKEPAPWSKNLCATRDFVTVLENNLLTCDDFLRPVWWIACLPDLDKTNPIWILLSSYECDRLITTFRRSKKSALFMYRPRLSKFHNNLLRIPGLHVTAIPHSMNIDFLCVEVEVGVFAGSMYFKDETEEKKFCSFLGLIPRPRNAILEIAFDTGIIRSNGFVPKEKRNNSKFIAELVGGCRFVKNPADLVIKLIIAHHHFMREESHVASIVDRGDRQLGTADVNAPKVNGDVNHNEVI